jgi:putative spermidine/putrescine transport system permease protein
MYLSRPTRLILGALSFLVIAFLFVPLGYVGLLAFNKSKGLTFTGFSTKWWNLAFNDKDISSEIRAALVGSLKTALLATVVALVLGTLASFAVHRFDFFGRQTISFFVILPIALPGIVTGIALNAGFREILHVKLGFLTLVVAHATFCIVVVFNNVVARLRRLPGNLEEASADLGAHTFQTFRYVTFPLLRSALFAGALLSFALSFDEIVVTTFTAGAGFKTLPQWIFNNYARPNNAPVVNVVALSVVLASIIPAYIAQRLAGSD